MHRKIINLNFFSHIKYECFNVGRQSPDLLIMQEGTNWASVIHPAWNTRGLLLRYTRIYNACTFSNNT